MSMFRCRCGCGKELDINLSLFDVRVDLRVEGQMRYTVLLSPHSAAEMAAELSNAALEAIERLDKERQ